MVVINASVPDLTRVIHVHKSSFPGFFLTELGDEFLCTFYSSFIDNKNSVFLVSKQDSAIVGFVVGCIHPHDFFATMRRIKWHKFLFASRILLLKKPIFVFKKLIAAFFYRGESPGEMADGVLLSSLAVHPAYSAQGIGKKLVEDFCHHAKNLGGKSVYVITDKEDNEAVNAFYRKAGFFVESTLEKTGARKMNRLVKLLD